MFRVLIDTMIEGDRLVEIPKCRYEFISVQNNTRFDINFYKGRSFDSHDLIGSCPSYTIMTFSHDKMADFVNIVWKGGAPGQSERALIWFSEENLGWVGNFRPPIVPVVGGLEPQEKTLFSKPVVSVENLVVGEHKKKKIIKSIYMTNTTIADAVITINHMRGAIITPIVSGLVIPPNSTYALGYFVILNGEVLNISSVTTGAVALSIYGVEGGV